MGVLEFFGTLLKNGITSTSIKPDVKDKMMINHLFLDFNSIIHVSGQKIVSEVNAFFKMALKKTNNADVVNNDEYQQNLTKYKMESDLSEEKDPEKVIEIFHEHFTNKLLDKLIIILVIKTILKILKTYCDGRALKTLMFAIDGVPSKGKMTEQKHRRYMGAITELYKKKLLIKYRDYLKANNNYLAAKYEIKWNRNKITPGTAFMHKLVIALNRDETVNKFKSEKRTNMKIIISDMYEVGEGEKKIINYIDKKLKNTNDTVVVYSPDADMILLCMLLPVTTLYVLRHNQQTTAQKGDNIYDLVNVDLLKQNIAYYINNNPNHGKKNFKMENINNDIVCISTLFGNDFVPKIETLNVKRGFQSIMDAYLKSLLKLNEYLVQKQGDINILSLKMLREIMKNLIPEEQDFIRHNQLYNEYITIGQIKNTFDYMEINSKNLISTVSSFTRDYGQLKNAIKNKNKGTIFDFEKNDIFMTSLKKSLMVFVNGQCLNTLNLSNEEVMKLLSKYYSDNENFPGLNINLNTWSHSITDSRHKKIVAEKKLNDYEKEKYKFDNMLDEYYVKFNAQPLDLQENKIPNFYKKYFGVDVLYERRNLSISALNIMHDYVEGVFWVFNYYFNDKTYLNKWYYHHKKAPLLKDIYTYLMNIDEKTYFKIFSDLKKYQVSEKNFFNPIEQLIYVSPMTDEIIKLLPSNYRNYMSNITDPFFKNYFIDIQDIVDNLWEQDVSQDIDCHSIPFFNKCLIKSLHVEIDDDIFLSKIRKVTPNDESTRRSKSELPPY